MAADTIRVTGAGCVLIGPEGRTPPLPFITVDAKEAAALIAQKLAIAYAGEEAEAEPAPAPTPPPAAPAPEPVVTPPAPEPEAPAPEPETAPEPNAPEGGEGGEEGESRADSIAAALDLMEADDLVKTGERAGKPKVSAIEAATGLTDVTTAEVDAALAARDAE